LTGDCDYIVTSFRGQNTLSEGRMKKTDDVAVDDDDDVVRTSVS
jgi:hypothetical protein